MTLLASSERSKYRWREELQMIFEPIVFVRTAMLAALTAFLIWGVLAIIKPVAPVPAYVNSQAR